MWVEITATPRKLLPFDEAIDKLQLNKERIKGRISEILSSVLDAVEEKFCEFSLGFQWLTFEFTIDRFGGCWLIDCQTGFPPPA
jgi:hypothetical protein